MRAQKGLVLTHYLLTYHVATPETWRIVVSNLVLNRLHVVQTWFEKADYLDQP